MENSSKYLTEKFIKCKLSPVKFIIYNILSLNGLSLIYIWNIINSIGSNYEKDNNINLLIVLLTLLFWSGLILLPIAIMEELSLYISPRFAIISIGLVVISLFSCIVIYIILSFKIKHLTEILILEFNKDYKLNSFLCIIFPIFYQYFILYNINRVGFLQHNPNVNHLFSHIDNQKLLKIINILTKIYNKIKPLLRFILMIIGLLFLYGLEKFLKKFF